MKCFMVQITIFMRIMGGGGSDGGNDYTAHTNLCKHTDTHTHAPVDFYYIILMQSHSGCFAHTIREKKAMETTGKNPRNPVDMTWAKRVCVHHSIHAPPRANMNC